MHDNDFDADRGQECDVGRYARPDCWVGVVHERTAVFHDKDGVAKSLDIRERFKQYGCFGGDVEV
jgi:hypothetical protein